MALRALLLDFGGTVARERPSRGELYARAARARGLAVDGERMGALMHEVHDALPARLGGAARYADPWFEAFIRAVFHGRLGLPEAALPALTRELFATFSDAASFEILPGTRELLAAARARGLRTALISNWSEHLGALVAALGLAPSFDAVLSSAVLGVEKPDPALFQLALARLGVAPEDAVHAGDHPVNDVAGARAAGIRPVLVSRAVPRPNAGDTPVLGSLTELGAHLRLF